MFRYLERLKANEDVEAMVKGQVRYEMTVRAAFNTVWERLSVPLRRAWQLAACFEAESASFELAEAVGISEVARADLADWHLLDHGHGRWNMHRLTRAFGQGAGTTEEHDEVRLAFIEGCLRRAAEIDDRTGFRIYQADQAHLDAALSKLHVVLGDADPRVVDYMDRIATALQEGGELQAAHELFKKALNLDIRNFGEDHKRILTRWANLAVVSRFMGDLTSARYFNEKALESAIKIFGDDHSDVSSIRANLGVVLTLQGDYSAALNMLRKALETDIRVYGIEDPIVAQLKGNIARVLFYLKELEQARILFEEELKSYIRNFDADHPWIGKAKFNLSIVCRELGDFEVARDLVEQVIANRVKNFGEQSPHTAVARSALAKTLFSLGDLERATNEARLALEGIRNQPEGSEFRILVERELRKIS